MKTEIENRRDRKMPDTTIEHIYNSALTAANYLGLDSGLHILNQAFVNLPDIRDEKIEQLKKELAK
ncbi:hypothetical protein D3C86_1691940 [compost metagenome]